MARAPRARIPKSTGQGVSRLSYQRSYDLAHKGDAPKIARSPAMKDAKASKATGGGGRTEYAKGGKGGGSSGVNIAPYMFSDIEAIREFGSGVTNKPSARLEPGEVKKLKK